MFIPLTPSRITASYLKDLRMNRPARPTGSRPLPGKTSPSDLQDNLPPRAASAFSMYRQTDAGEDEPRSSSSLASRRTSTNRPNSIAFDPPRSVSGRSKIFPAEVFSRTLPDSSIPYYQENQQRRQEREEARSLRDALQQVDLQDEGSLFQAAQDEAAELVWAHQNPGVPYKDPHGPYRNPDNTKRYSGRISSIKGPRSAASSTRIPSGSSGGSSSSPDSQKFSSSWRSSLSKDKSYGPLKKNSKVNFELPAEETDGSKTRNISSGSSKGIFRNPNDQIYEEPRDPRNPEQNGQASLFGSDSSALKSKPRNSLPRMGKPLPWLRDRSSNNDRPILDKIARFDSHKNPPSQSQNPAYTKNDTLPKQPPSTQEETAPTKGGMEIRSDDIRAATSKKFKDRSDNLPKPSAVSDRAGRPIVSFDPKWQPIINVPDIQEPTISEISEPSRQEIQSAARSSQSQQPAPKKQTSNSRGQWYSPYTRSGVPTACCESCSLGISGRIVTAGGSRFHPECFTCFHCQTALECVAFYEEPESSRAERLANAQPHDEEAHVPRFYCHLDFHELYSPRCKSCKTPIEGEVVVACGAEWHVGHFFCAECGDPFNPQTPFVEKDGFAWCLNCHSHRTAPRCQGCKQNVLDEVVISAIGGQWHERCFVCHECGDGFGPEGRFFVREGEPRRTAKGRIIGGPVQLAICENCEGIRLKAPGMC
ncbi:hypothetical protein N7510_008925 [Penicillium lagena]|uniref:uncharacterized protein n=1 Tax=Penicillium lagena TaxID=94218 RepID=UPI002541459A|nr:uncharacterized protein N7510_008925 [Penicillium lagena]KAJ5606144.1 hypothetical protein N7510_008925 [Penicillium lagena]